MIHHISLNAVTESERHAEMSDVSEESLLDYFSSGGGGSGRVRNADIVRTFKPFIGHADPQLRGKLRRRRAPQ